MTPYELALARQRTYRLFGRLFLEGITADLLPLLETVPELAERAQPFHADQAAAAHYHLISVTLFPYESIFRDPSRLLGGEISDQVAALYRQNGFDVLSDADHIGHELSFMGHLCAAEAAALAQGDSKAATLWSSRQQAFLAAHLLTWLAPLAAAVDSTTNPFYNRLANLTLDLCADHLGEVATVSSPRILPDPPQLAAEDSGLKDIAGFLVTPPYSGLFLSRDAISDLARKHNLPRGFGDRAQMLTNLLRTAGQYDAAPDVLNDLAALCRTWSTCYEEPIHRFPEHTPWIRPWQERVLHTVAALEQITAELA